MAIEKAKDRLEILRRIEEYEVKGWFSKDVEDDPPTIPLLPDQVDYLNEKFTSRLWTKYANMQARRFISTIIKNRQLIIKEVRGAERFAGLNRTGVVITCNHFNAFDNFAVYKALEKYLYRRELYKVIREGNYTNYTGFYGFLFKHCNTLPLSSNAATMKKFFRAVRVLLSRGRQILIYPEQGMWWNYRKPRPLENGSFKFAAMNNAPVLPVFITMADSDVIGQDGFPVQEYTVHILEPIYPRADYSVRQNAVYMKERNYALWKDVYERTYGIPLTYTTQGTVTAGGVVMAPDAGKAV